MTEQFLSIRPRQLPRLARNLVVPFAVFVLLASLVLVGWMSWLERRESLARFERLASTNAKFVSELRHQPSSELAGRLATILDLGVGFEIEGGASVDWPTGLAEPIGKLRTLGRPVSKRIGGYEIGVAPLIEKPEVSLVLLRPVEGFWAGLGSQALIPAFALALGCGGLAMFVGIGIVRPLSALNRWLPNLDAKPDVEPEPIPESVLRRPDEIGALGRKMEETGKRLREEQNLRRQSERLATLGRIATSLAHEIKNPAAAIAMHADLLSQTSESGGDSVELIREEIERITDLVNQWLFVARSQPARTQPRDLRQLLERVARRVGPALEHARVSLKIEPEKTEPAPILADAPRMEQVLRNLLINAMQAMPKGGEIRANLSVCQDSIRLEIEDEGSGFSEEARERFGEPFFSEREGGMGIGLTLASEVVQGHGGKIWPENRAEGGARVVVEIPKHKSDER